MKNSKRRTPVRVPVSEIPCYAIYSDDFHYSDDWGNAMIDLWIKTRQALVRGEIKAEQFRDRLIDGIVDKSGWRSSFNQAAREADADPEDDDLFDEYVALHRNGAFDLIPHGLHAEWCYLPEWDGRSIDDLMENNGLRSDRWRSCYFSDVQPGRWLEVFLRMVNLSSVDLILAARELRGGDGEIFAKKCAEAHFDVVADASKPALVSTADAITIIENAYTNAAPTVHCEIDVRALFELDPTKNIRLTSARGQVHLGLHEGYNGAGFMESYSGAIEVPASAAGFVGANRFSYGINKVYGIVRSYFYATPVTV